MEQALETVVAESATTVDLTLLESLVAENGELLLHIYTAQLFAIGVAGAVFVVFLLYKFLRKVY